MIAVLRNYPSVVDAKAWIIDGVNLNKDSKGGWFSKEMFIDAVQKAMGLSYGKSVPSFPSFITESFKQVVGVTFNEAEGAVEEMYDFNWGSVPHYGDLLLVGTRSEFLYNPETSIFYLWMKNDRDTHLSIIFDFKKYISDPVRSKKDAKYFMNFCPPNVPEGKKDESTMTVIALMKDDEPLMEQGVLTMASSNPSDITTFSSLL